MERVHIKLDTLHWPGGREGGREGGRGGGGARMISLQVVKAEGS